LAYCRHRYAARQCFLDCALSLIEALRALLKMG
jgi:hypothetical protein